jgi:hypothetical protein
MLFDPVVAGGLRSMLETKRGRESGERKDF